MLLFLLVAAAYAPVTRAGFIWDDPQYVVDNPLLRTWEGLWSIWTRPTSGAHQWYPLTLTTFWLEYQAWGLHPLGYHVVNVLLHAASACLVFCVCRRLRVPGALLVAALFAVHPVHVESVAWVTELKNVLSGFFSLMSVLCFLRFVDGRRVSWRAYAAALACFASALLSKSVASTVPAALPLVLWASGRRVTRRTWLGLLPMFALGLAMAAITVHVEHTGVGARGPEWDLAPVARFVIAGRALWFYVGKLMWPADLCFSYARWEVGSVTLADTWPLAAAVVVVLAAFAARRRVGRWPVAALCYFGGTLLPALGFINVYPMRYTFVADHYPYAASLGVLALFAGVAVAVARRAAGGPVRLARSPAWVFLVGGLLAVLVGSTASRTLVYRDELALWTDTVEKNPAAYHARTNLGVQLAAAGDGDGAAAQFRAAARLRPDLAWPLNNLGLLQATAGDLDGAERSYRAALAREPDLPQVHYNLGLVLLRQGRAAEAQQAFRAALARDPAHPGARAHLEDR
ncbi:MAG: tetratricopeptide repeat protein [Deltaproteobacteria bacterium]|nr:tetratricopeptide repeat protein [Deltaproteobacteria bacterium]